jgi:hypothetical protein
MYVWMICRPAHLRVCACAVVRVWRDVGRNDAACRKLISPESLFSAPYHGRPRFPVSCHCIPLQDNWSGNAGCCCRLCRRRGRESPSTIQKVADSTSSATQEGWAGKREGQSGANHVASEAACTCNARREKPRDAHIINARREGGRCVYCTILLPACEGGTGDLEGSSRAASNKPRVSERNKDLHDAAVSKKTWWCVAVAEGLLSSVPRYAHHPSLRSSPDQPSLLPVREQVVTAQTSLGPRHALEITYARSGGYAVR